MELAWTLEDGEIDAGIPIRTRSTDPKTMPTRKALADIFGPCDVLPTNAHFPVMMTCVAAMGEQLLLTRRILKKFMTVKDLN
ncbi:MAG: hypothetical protein DRP71_10090 [Verrucomicrobia bacterium]|nr:MAG: hypothetical protein DRP71_10090 [Verrucomicrobiota bacterium]